MSRELLIALFFASVVFTFVLLAGRVLPEFLKLLAKRIPLTTLLQHFVLIVPYVLTFSLPMAMLTATLLVFGRLSADNELTAIRASGMSLLNLIAPAIVLSILLVLACLYINCHLAPKCRSVSRSLMLESGMRDPSALIQPGEWTRAFPGYVIYARDRVTNQLFNLNVHVLDDRERPVQNLRADRAEIISDLATQKLTLILYDVRSEIYDSKNPQDLSKLKAGVRAQKYPLTFDMRGLIEQARAKRDFPDMTFSDLLHSIYGLRAQGITPSSLWLEAHKRIANSFACFAFLLIGIPLGIKTHRRETSVGVAISLLLVFVYYLFGVMAQTFKHHPEYYPELILWTPNLIFEVLGLVMIWRVSRA